MYICIYKCILFHQRKTKTADTQLLIIIYIFKSLHGPLDPAIVTFVRSFNASCDRKTQMRIYVKCVYVYMSHMRVSFLENIACGYKCARRRRGSTDPHIIKATVSRTHRAQHSLCGSKEGPYIYIYKSIYIV